jgi:cbb3-type cytochrome oxidase subunit 3
MYKNILEHISGVEIYPIIALFIFILCFLLIVLWAFTLNKNYIKKMENIPLDDNSDVVNIISDDAKSTFGGVK